MSEPRPPEWHELYQFWFHPETPTAKPERMKRWFVADPAFDAALKSFEPWLSRPVPGDWDETAEGALAIVLLFDQLPRNLYRGTAKAFAWDEKGLAEAKRAVARGQDKWVAPLERGFFYLPFEHDERLENQDEAVRLFTALAKEMSGDEAKLGAMYLDFAEKHREVIRQYGRFPHRNKILGRVSTAAELEYLARPGAGF